MGQRLLLIILVICVGGHFCSKEIVNEFENKVSQLIKKLMSSKNLMSEQHTSILKERLAKFDKNFRTNETKVNNQTTTTTEKSVVTPVSTELLLTKVNKINQTSAEVESSTKHPLWDPLSAVGSPKTRRPYVISFTPYTTPTPLPKRPDWNKDDWIQYFNLYHNNF